MSQQDATIESYSSIASVERAMRLLEALAESRDGLTASGLAKQLGIHRSLVFRLLASLVAAGYVTQNEPGSQYRLSLQLLRLTNTYLRSTQLDSLFHPILRQLAQTTSEQVSMAVVEGNSLIRVASIEGRDLAEPGRLQVAYGIGSHPTNHASSSGKAWLSKLPREQAMSLVAEQGMTRFTEFTITSFVDLLAELERTRAQGFAISLEEEELGVNAIAACIEVQSDRDEPVVVGTVTVTVPVARMSGERLIEMAPLVIDAAAEIASAWPPH